MYLILAGGGDAYESKPIDELFIKSLSSDKKLLYIPIAWKSGDFEGCKAWFEETFSKLGNLNYEMWTDVKDKSYLDLDGFGGIYIGGGNTYSLMHDFRFSGFDKLLLKFIESDRPVYGGSAGAIIFGASIDTASFGLDADSNDVNISDTSGFNLVSDYAIQCHYESDQDNEIFDFVNNRKTSVIAIGAKSGILVKSDDISVIGTDPVYKFENGKKVELRVGTILQKGQ